MYKLKTANLISFSCQVGSIISGADIEKRNALKNFGDNLGIAFQISDDILDVIGDENLIGKKIGSDSKNRKRTYLNYFDIEESIIEENVIRQTVMPSHLRTGRFISKPLRNMTSKVVTQTQNLVRMNPPGNFRARNYKVNSTCGSTRRGKSTVPKLSLIHI